MKYLYLYVIVCAILAIVWGILEARVKGYLGEAKISSILSRLPNKEYFVINNVLLKTEFGTTQIDHVVVSQYGIFVIETKNYKGWITGGEHAEQWTQNIYGEKHSFRNPLKQNYGHIKALQSLLNLPGDKFISIVAFSSRASIKVNTNHNVIYFSKLKKKICSYKDIILDSNALVYITQTIQNANIDSKENRKSHIKEVRNNIEAKNKKISAGICPKCGGMLTKRKGKYGSFIGCSNYPKCRFTR